MQTAAEFIEYSNDNGYGVALCKAVKPTPLYEAESWHVLEPYVDAFDHDWYDEPVEDGASVKLSNELYLVIHSGLLEQKFHEQQTSLTP